MELYTIKHLAIWGDILRVCCIHWSCNYQRISPVPVKQIWNVWVQNLHDSTTNLFVQRKHENMYPCTGSRLNTNYERIASWGGCQYWTVVPRILETPLATHCCSQRLNHSAMTHPSKTDWHQLSGITHWLQQRVDYGQERSTGLLFEVVKLRGLLTYLRLRGSLFRHKRFIFSGFPSPERVT